MKIYCCVACARVCTVLLFFILLFLILSSVLNIYKREPSVPIHDVSGTLC